MTPQPCIAPHGEEGDCWRACIASVLDMEVGDVPNFLEASKFDSTKMEWERMTRDWLKERGLGLFRTYCSAGWTLDKLLECFCEANADVPLILVGWSGDDAHAVVAMNGRVVHDPSAQGLTGPIPCPRGPDCCGGTWCLYAVVVLDGSLVPAFAA